jgi:hypothetical protein
MSSNIPSIKELIRPLSAGIQEGAPSSVETIYKINERKVIDVIDWEAIFKWFPRRCHVLLVAPHHNSPDYTDYSIQGADQFFSFANPLVTVRYLRDANANRANVENELREFNPALVVHYDHGSMNAVYGEGAANTPQAVLDTGNSDRLRFRVMSTISCLSASGLGPNAVGKGCTSYIGYNDLHWIITTTHNAFWNCGSMVHRLLVLGYTTRTAFNAAITCYNSNIASFAAAGDTLTATYLTIDRDRLTLVGSDRATTCNRRFIIPQLKEYIRLNQIPDPIWPPDVFNLMEREDVEST